MRSFRIITPLVKNKSARTLSIVAGLLLVLMTLAYAYTNPVSKYPTGFVIATASMGTAGMTLEKGSVFGFNSAKSGADTEAYATIQEGACASPATLHNFSEGKQGFVTSTTLTGIVFSTLGTDGHLTASGAAQTSLSGTQQSRTFAWDKKFLWDCGNPTVTTFVMSFRLPTYEANLTLGANNFQVSIVKPNAVVVNLNVGGGTQYNLPTTAGAVGWTQLTGTIPAWTFDQPGLYTLRINGALRAASNASKVILRFDDVDLTVTSGFKGYSQDVQFNERATPYSAGGAYVLEVKARKTSGDTTESTFIQVCGDNSTPCASWVTRYTVPPSQSTWNVYNGYTLTTAEYNGGNVRIRYIDDVAINPDSARGGVDVEYQRINVDQGVCVDLTRSIESDCGKCHNYGGDVTKPWPSTGMHNQHAQSESISDCLWCHPDMGTNAGHSDGVVKITGTKLFRATDGNLSTPLAPANALYNADKTCSNIACHMNQLTPRWNATFVTSGFNGTTLIARNCSRCHNTGSAGTDSSSNLNLSVGWPNTTSDGGGHISHNAAVAFDENSCQSNGSCHPDNRGQHSIVGDNVVDVKMAPNYGSPNAVIKYIKVSAAKSDGYCVNVTCHGGQATPKFNLSSTNPINLASTNGSSCVMCHVGEQANGWGTAPGNATQYNSPISGLHRGSPPTSGQDHGAGLTNGCQACHFLASLTKHFQDGGQTNMDNPAMDSMLGASFVTANGYTTGTGTAPNYTTPPTCAVTTNGCHAEGTLANRNPVTTWKRTWSWDSYAAETPDVEKVKQCNGCHGHWGTFTAGVVEPHVLSNSDTALKAELIGNHGESGVNCGTMCHAQGATLPTPYLHGVAIGTTSKDMSLNNNATPVVNGTTTVGCNNACHANDPGVPDGIGGSHVFANAPWVTTVNHTNGPTVTCKACHGGDNATVSNINYWPSAGASYPKRPGEHDKHIEALAVKLGYGFDALLTDQEQKTMCAFCHTITATSGETTHNDNVAPATLTSPTSFNPMWSTLAANYPNQVDNATVAASYTGGNGTGGSCSGIDCHSNKATLATNEWYDASSSGCILCHTDPTAETVHLSHANAAATYGVTIVCGNCHGGTPVWGTPGTKPSTLHYNGTFNVTAGGGSTFTYAGAIYPTTKGTCGSTTSNCHRADASIPTTAVINPRWDQPQANPCDFCHLEAMTSGKHNQHMISNSLPNTTNLNECYVCHNSTATSGGLASGANHMNSVDDLNFNTAYANYEAFTAARNGALVGNSTTCSNTKCHNGVTTPQWSLTVTCFSCHNTGATGPLPSAASVAGKHANHANNDATYTDCDNCHGTAAYNVSGSRGASAYTATGGGGAAQSGIHQNLTVDIYMSGTSHLDTTNTAGGVNYATAGVTHIDDGTCNNTAGCHGTTGSQGWATASTLPNGCRSCHGGDNATIGSLNYWPSAGASFPKRGGEHDKHVQAIALKRGYPFTSAITDPQQKEICSFCHTSTAGVFRIHADNTGPASVTGTYFNPLWSTITSGTASTADGGTAAAYTPGNGTGGSCSGIDCHNNQATAATSEWYDASTGTCLLCHTLGGAGGNPTTGLHNIVAVGPQHHDDGLSGGCGACHGTAPATHINGTFTADSGTNTVAERFVSRAGMTYTEITPTLTRSGTCSGTGGLAACHTDGGNWTRLWSREADSTATATSSQRCNVCHGQWSTITNSSGWMAGTSHYKAGGTNSATNTRTKIHDGTNNCDACHVYGAAGAGRHNVIVRQINLNNNSVTTSRTGTYPTGTAGCSSGTAGCHTDGAAGPRNLPFSYFPVGSVAGALIPPPPCTGCHDSGAGTPPAPIVSSVNGSHISANGGAFVACEQCHEKHADATAAGPNVVYVWTTSASGAVPTMNWPYTSHLSKIRLGGTATASTTFTYNPSATTEAQMCWGCHDKFNVSEWGSNVAAKTGNITYDYGDLYTDNTGTTKTSNWTTGYWRSGKGRSSQSATNPYWYKRGAIQSTHSVNFDSGTVALTTSGNSLGFGRTENKDSVANIRCSWCHDVHGNHNGIKGDTTGGAGTNDQPYMRGSWKGNPYAEDGAPQLGNANWSLQGNFGLVPRGSALPTNTGITAVSKAGGWWIDQNSGNPNSTTTVNATSGLCEQCHGINKTGAWSTASIGTLNWGSTGIEANNSNWTSGYNGHASTVLNGPGRGAALSTESYARNIFTRTKRGSATMSTAESLTPYTDMGLASLPSGLQGYSYRGTDGYVLAPTMSKQYSWQAFAWGTPSSPVGQTTKWAVGSQALTFSMAESELASFDAQANYHTFTCSKCHNPHASRLPKLMITNCLDTNHNTWEDNLAGTLTSLPAPWTNTRASQWASAQNCHRLDARASLTTGQSVSLGRGWNRVTPWLEFTTPNASRANINPDVLVP